MKLSGRLNKFLFPQLPMKEVAPVEVSKRLEDCQAEGVISALYDFGLAVSNETLENTAQLDAKGITLLGYSGALLAFLLLSNESLKAQGWLNWPYNLVVLISEIAATWAIVRSFLALRVQSFRSLSETDWFQKDILPENEPIGIRRFYTRSLHAVNQVGARNNAQKSEQVRLAQRWLTLGAIFVGGIVVWGVLPSILVPLFTFVKHIGVWLGGRFLGFF